MLLVNILKLTGLCIYNMSMMVWHRMFNSLCNVEKVSFYSSFLEYFPFPPPKIDFNLIKPPPPQPWFHNGMISFESVQQARKNRLYRRQEIWIQRELSCESLRPFLPPQDIVQALPADSADCQPVSASVVILAGNTLGNKNGLFSWSTNLLRPVVKNFENMPKLNSEHNRQKTS